MHVSAGVGAGWGLGAARPTGTLRPWREACASSLQWVSGLGSFLSFVFLGYWPRAPLPSALPIAGGPPGSAAGGNSQLPPPAAALTPATMLPGPCFLAGEAYVAGGETEAWKEAARLLGKA